MRRGTTPTHTFTIPKYIQGVKRFRVCYAQNGRIVLKKTGDGPLVSDNKITVDLTQEDTFMFEPDAIVRIQIRILTEDDKSIVSDIIKVSVRDCLDNEVLA